MPHKNPVAGQKYNRQRNRVWRNLAYHAARLYEPGDLFTLEELGQKLSQLPEKPGRYTPNSIRRYIQAYFTLHTESPLLRAERDGYWTLNPFMYRARAPPPALKRGRPRKNQPNLTDGSIGDANSDNGGI